MPQAGIDGGEEVVERRKLALHGFDFAFFGGECNGGVNCEL
jgi:hypothetical protein